MLFRSKKAARDEEEVQTASADDVDGDAPEEIVIDPADDDADEISEDENLEAEAQLQELEEKVETS